MDIEDPCKAGHGLGLHLLPDPVYPHSNKGHGDASDLWVSMSTWTWCSAVLKRGLGHSLSLVRDHSSNHPRSSWGGHEGTLTCTFASR